MKPIIGLIPLYDDKLSSYWMLPGYMKAIEEAGGAPFMLPLSTDTDVLDRLFDICDGLLITGGHDISPALYGEAPLECCGTLCPDRDFMEEYLFSRAMEKDLPVFGICRGIQIMNALLGGSLYQHLPLQHPSGISHSMTPPYDKPVHTVDVPCGTMLSGIIGSGTHSVNSYHHQAVKELASAAVCEAISEDGLVEALSVKGKRFMLAVQWHPEFSYRSDPKGSELFKAFVNACSAN